VQTISIGELQKNVGILTRLTEALTIVDKRRNRKVAVVYPVEEKVPQEDVVSQLAGKYNHLAKHDGKSFREIREEAMDRAMREKYGFTD